MERALHDVSVLRNFASLVAMVEVVPYETRVVEGAAVKVTDATAT